MEKYSWNFNEDDEIWRNDTHDSIEDCVSEAKQALAEENYRTDEPPTVVYIGKNIRFAPSVNVESLLDDIQEQAYNQCGDIGGDWEAYDYKKKDELAELTDSMNELLHTWLKKYGYYPDIWSIEGVKGYGLEESE